MKNEPLVSVIIATYNRAHLLDRAIKSVFKQAYKNWEIIITDDASEDSTAEIVKKRQRKTSKIRYFKNKKNQGISKTYNWGFKNTKGKYIAILDDDDFWIDKNKLKKQIGFLEKNPGYGGCGGGVIVINESNKELYRYLKPEKDAEIKRSMLFSNPMANTTTLFRKSLAEKIDFYDTVFPYSGDRDFWLKMGKIAKLYNFPRYFACYQLSSQNTSIAKIRPHLKSTLLIMRRYKNDYPYYYPALLFNIFQYLYAFLPPISRRLIHKYLARLKKKLFK